MIITVNAARSDTSRRPLGLLLCAGLLLGACEGNGGLGGGGQAADASAPPAPEANDALLLTDATPAATGVLQTIGDYGKLDGGLSGYAWVAGGTGTTWLSPSPCNDQQCFQNTGGVLCAQGSIAALACTSPSSCDWNTNWGAMIGWNPTPVQHEAWGAAAAAGIAVTYAGGPGEYRLMAHVVGDPDSTTYCVERYVSGQVATPSSFLSQCWANTGDGLPSFAVVDVLGLQLIAAQAPIDFNVCISAIALF
jgi:hypothetical protein